MTEIFSDGHKRVIAGRAQTLLERLESIETLEQITQDEADVETVFDDWKDLFPNEEAFERRLEREGVTREDCRTAIAADKLVDEEPLPEWIDQLEELVAGVQAKDPSDVPRKFGPSPDWSERPFPQLSAAVGACIREQLADELVERGISNDAIGDMTEWFRLRFEERFARVLFVEFKTFVASHDRELAFADPETFDEPPREYYDRFIEYLFSGGFADLCEEYPMFARLLVIQQRQWTEHLEEFSRRVQADRESLTERFDVDGPLGAVRELEPLADDTHGDGRAIMRVTFDSGFTVVYKPRNVDAGETFYGLLERLNEYLPVPDFESPTYLGRERYGWMEWIEYDSCPDEAAVERYYQRAGALNCIGYFLEFTDCHFENLIVSGEHPMLVDAETVLEPYVAMDQRPGEEGVGPVTDDSVLLTALLPYEVDQLGIEENQDELASMWAGFSTSSEEGVFEQITTPAIKAANTDVMSVETTPATLDRSENVPVIDGEDQPPGEYLEEFLEGFESTYEELLQLRDEQRLAHEVGFPDVFEGVENRLVYRDTMNYTSTINSLASRTCLNDGVRFALEIESLSVPFCDGRVADPQPWSLYDAERAALKRFDPPRFTCRTDETELRRNGRKLGVNVEQSGIERCRQRIESAGRDDLKEQVEYIRGCFGSIPDPNRTLGKAPESPREWASDDQLRQAATDVFDRIEDAALETERTYHWESVAPWTEQRRLTVQPADGSLYAGRGGIAVFSAALYRVTGEDRYRTFALDAIRPVREQLRSDRGGSALTRHGGALGIGSVAYGLAVVGDLLEEPSLLEDATQTAEYVTPESLQTDRTYDVIDGAAGTIHGLLAAHQRYESDELVTAAVACGDHLLDERVTVDGGPRVWQTMDDCPPLNGFGHGVSGIAYALLRLGDVTGDESYRTAALEALEYESNAFSEEAGNWPDYREWSNSTYLDEWCYGRSGIGLARAGMAEYTTNDLVTQGLERAVTNVPTTGINPVDDLCSGEAGRAEFLLEVENRLDRRSGEARELLGGVLARKQTAGGYRCVAGTDRITEPTLFHGIAGIGYAMLRVTDPEPLPCVLLWE